MALRLTQAGVKQPRATLGWAYLDGLSEVPEWAGITAPTSCAPDVESETDSTLKRDSTTTMGS